MPPHLRIARPVSDLARSTELYCRGLGLHVLGSFKDSDGFDVVMLGIPDAEYHFELTYCRTHPIAPSPTAEDVIVLYIPSKAERDARCAGMATAGFIPYRRSIPSGASAVKPMKILMAIASSSSKPRGALMSFLMNERQVRSAVQ